MAKKSFISDIKSALIKFALTILMLPLPSIAQMNPPSDSTAVQSDNTVDTQSQKFNFDLNHKIIPEDRDAYLVSISLTGQRHQWDRELCSVIHAGLNKKYSADIQCHRIIGEFMEPSVQEAKKSGHFRGQIVIEKAGLFDARVIIHDWTKNEIVQLPPAYLKLDITDEEKFFTAMYKISSNYRDYDKNKVAIINSIDKMYDSSSEKVVFEGEKYAGKENYRRFFLETGAALGYAAYWYYSDSDNKNDWEFDAWKGVKSKINGDGVRFDDNSKALNVGHAFAGMGYYQLARSNGLSQQQSFLSSFLLSAAWETVIEYREILSINDMIHTGLSGPLIGEVFYQMSRSLRNRDSLFAKAFAVLLDGPSSINSWLDRNKDIAKHEAAFTDSLQLEIGFKEFGFTGDVWSLPEGEKVAALLPQGFHSHMELGIRRDNGEMTEFHLLTKLAFMGYMKRNMTSDKHGNYEGYEFIISPASEFEWMERKIDGDFLIHARVIGGMVQLVAKKKGYTIRASYEIYGDFAMLKSYALNDYKVDYTLEGFQAIVQQEEYYYGLGLSQKAQVEVQKSRFSAGGSIQENDIHAINSRDRYQEQVTKRFDARDMFDRMRLWFKFNISPRLTLEVSSEKTYRTGQLYAYQVSNRTRLTTGRIIYKF